MPNHIHLIVQARDGYKLSQIISDFKKHTTREILRELKKDNRRYLLGIIKSSYFKKKGYENQVWRRENYPEAIETEKFLQSKINYIHQNPVTAEYVDKPEDWNYSSARYRILQQKGVIELDEYDY